MSWMEIWQIIDWQAGWAFLDRGGALMYLLLVCSVMVLAITLERWLRIRRARTNTDMLFSPVETMIARDDMDGACAHVRFFRGPLAAVLRVVLESQSREKADLEEAALMEARRELRLLNQRLPALGLLAGLAPLLGLLGTVIGMIKAFQQVAAAQGAVNPSMLANGIWEALLTTGAGLSVAIPALIFHHALEQRVRRCAFEMDYFGAALIRLLSGRPETETASGPVDA
ncbi:MAG: MotA/TolQ/ExbB proton channel family protein [Candidatus Tectomicrobia bacterium]|nr:MotA/TolQ/ExbB proton channel family protein [Candidatus Tectomicrobia bacterium]